MIQSRVNKNIKAHPIYACTFLWRLLFILVLPVLKGVLQYILYRRISGVLLLEGVALGIIVALSAAKTAMFSLHTENGFLAIKNGIFYRKNAVIPLKNISSITFNEYFPLDIFSAVSVSVNTEVGVYGKKDFEFILYKTDAEWLEYEVYGKKPPIELHFPIGKIALLSASASSALTGLFVGVPVINQFGKLLNVGIMQILNDITSATLKIKTYFPPVINAVTLLFLAIYGFAFVVAFLKNLFFRFSVDSEKLEIMSGFYFRKRRIFRKSAINNLCIDQTLLMQLFKMNTLRVSIGGYGGEKGEKSTVVPAMKRNVIKSRFSSVIPLLYADGELIRPDKTALTARRFLLIPHTYTMLILGCGATLVLLFPSFERLFVFVSLVLLVLNGFYAYVSYRAFKHSGIRFGKTVLVRCTSRLTAREFYADYRKIGVITIYKTPFDKRLGTCKIRLTVRSESSDSVKVRNIPFEPIAEKIESLYGIKL